MHDLCQVLIKYKQVSSAEMFFGLHKYTLDNLACVQYAEAHQNGLGVTSWSFLMHNAIVHCCRGKHPCM